MVIDITELSSHMFFIYIEWAKTDYAADTPELFTGYGTYMSLSFSLNPDMLSIPDFLTHCPEIRCVLLTNAKKEVIII